MKKINLNSWIKKIQIKSKTHITNLLIIKMKTENIETKANSKILIKKYNIK